MKRHHFEMLAFLFLLIPFISGAAINKKPICTISLNGKALPSFSRNSILHGGDSPVISWTTKGADSVTLDSYRGEKLPASGSRTEFIPYGRQHTTYEFAIGATNKYGRTSCMIAATVKQDTNVDYRIATQKSEQKSSPAPTCFVSADKWTVKKGEQVLVTWKSTNATAGTWQGGDSASLTGSQSFTMTYSRSFGVTFTGPGGRAACGIVVTIEGDTSMSGKG